jgi:hypothetical protein
MFCSFLVDLFVPKIKLRERERVNVPTNLPYSPGEASVIIESSEPEPSQSHHGITLQMQRRRYFQMQRIYVISLKVSY